jgi:hypothetical protein
LEDQGPLVLFFGFSFTLPQKTISTMKQKTKRKTKTKKKNERGTMKGAIHRGVGQTGRRKEGT